MAATEQAEKRWEKVFTNVRADGLFPAISSACGRGEQHTVNYGSAARQFLDGIETGDKEKKLYAELNYCIMHESCTSPLDYFARRSGRLYFDINGVKEDLEVCLDYFANAFNWPIARIEKERELVLTQIRILSLEDIKKASQV